MAHQHPVSQPWIWEFGTRDGKTVYDVTEFWDLPAVKAAVDASFADYVYEEVERRGIRGTSVLVNLSGDGRYQDTGHWVYRAESPVKRRRKALTVLDAHGLYPKTDSPLPLEVLEQLAAVLTAYDESKNGASDAS